MLDWELSTVGSPYGDVAYCCMPYNLPPASVNTPAAYPAFEFEPSRGESLFYF